VKYPVLDPEVYGNGEEVLSYEAMGEAFFLPQ
jgi:hypothetical protein